MLERKCCSQRPVVLATLLYTCGLSCSMTAHFLQLQKAGMAPVTVLRDAQVLGQRVRQRPLLKGQVLVLGADETYARARGRTVVLGMATDAQTGETLGVEILVEQDTAAFLRWLRPLFLALGVQALVTDDLSTYEPVPEWRGVQHQVCIAHMRKNVTKRLRTLPGQEAVKDAVRELMRDFPP